MDVPEHLYNHGEIYNLCTPRGTLTPEERFKINEHIVETINMLGRLPFPKELRRVPEWAGNHHEKLDGTGYPRRLDGRDCRPGADHGHRRHLRGAHRLGPPLQAAQEAQHRDQDHECFRDGGHICPDLFELFLTSGVFRKYGEEYLQPEQVDEVDIGEIVRRTSSNQE